MSNNCMSLQQHTTVTDLCDFVTDRRLILYLWHRFCRLFAFLPERGRTAVVTCTPPELEGSATGSLTPISLQQTNSHLLAPTSEPWRWNVTRASRESYSGRQIRTRQTPCTTRCDSLLGKVCLWDGSLSKQNGVLEVVMPNGSVGMKVAQNM